MIDNIDTGYDTQIIHIKSQNLERDRKLMKFYDVTLQSINPNDSINKYQPRHVDIYIVIGLEANIQNNKFIKMKGEENYRQIPINLN